MKKCRCKRDQDGNCVPCRDKMVQATQEMGVALREFLENVERLNKELNEKISRISREGVCRPCSIQYADLAISKMLLTMDGADRKVVEGIANGVNQKLGKIVKKRPLTERAWARIREANGWTR